MTTPIPRLEFVERRIVRCIECGRPIDARQCDDATTDRSVSVACPACQKASGADDATVVL